MPLPTGPSRDWGYDGGRVFRARSLTEGGYVAWVLRLVEIGAEGEGPCADVVEINRPDGLVDIADLGLTLAEAKLVKVENFVRPETIAAANAKIVAAQNALPIAHIWGSGEVASADGIRFVAPSSAIHAGPNPKYFGAGRGITYYNLVSDQFTGLNAIVVPGTLRDSLLILGLLLEQETDLDPTE